VRVGFGLLITTGTFRSIPLDNLEGLITFPSFHTAGAIMFIWALRKVPYVRWPAIALNAALIAATPIDGAHYFIDLVGGAVVAFAAIAMSYWICRFVPVEETMTVPVPAAVPEAARASV
jgi:membrane-associated phospholipid phosphatase